MFYVLLNNIRSLYNVGSVFRTADGAGVDKIILTGITANPPRKEISKTALGAEDTVPWEYIEYPDDAIKKLKSQGFQIVVLEQTEKSIDYKKAQYTFPVCLVIGHEREGVESEILQQADFIVQIPMHGRKESLNVSVAFGIVAYEISGKIRNLNSRK